MATYNEEKENFGIAFAVEKTLKEHNADGAKLYELGYGSGWADLEVAAFKMLTGKEYTQKNDPDGIIDKIAAIIQEIERRWRRDQIKAHPEQAEEILGASDSNFVMKPDVDFLVILKDKDNYGSMSDF